MFQGVGWGDMCYHVTNYAPRGDVRRGKNTVIVSRWANCLTSRGRIRG